MPDASLLECFPTPVDSPFVIEHVNEGFTSLCPKTGHPDFGRITVRYCPAKSCVELKSLKLYCQSFRNEGIFYEAVTNRIRDDLAKAMSPRTSRMTSKLQRSSRDAMRRARCSSRPRRPRASASCACSSCRVRWAMSR